MSRPSTSFLPGLHQRTWMCGSSQRKTILWKASEANLVPRMLRSAAQLWRGALLIGGPCLRSRGTMGPGSAEQRTGRSASSGKRFTASGTRPRFDLPGRAKSVCGAWGRQRRTCDDPREGPLRVAGRHRSPRAKSSPFRQPGYAQAHADPLAPREESRIFTW
jgi:hypothetical protein